MHKRDFLKKKFSVSADDPLLWKQYKQARNEVNISIKSAKRKYFNDNLKVCKSDPRRTWKLINELQSRQPKNSKIPVIKLGDTPISTPTEIAENFNNYFTHIGIS